MRSTFDVSVVKNMRCRESQQVLRQAVHRPDVARDATAAICGLAGRENPKAREMALRPSHAFFVAASLMSPCRLVDVATNG